MTFPRDTYRGPPFDALQSSSTAEKRIDSSPPQLTGRGTDTGAPAISIR